jgi:hypothetical protein
MSHDPLVQVNSDFKNLYQVLVDSDTAIRQFNVPSYLNLIDFIDSQVSLIKIEARLRTQALKSIKTIFGFDLDSSAHQHTSILANHSYLYKEYGIESIRSSLLRAPNGSLDGFHSFLRSLAYVYSHPHLKQNLAIGNVKDLYRQLGLDYGGPKQEAGNVKFIVSLYGVSLGNDKMYSLSWEDSNVKSLLFNLLTGLSVIPNYDTTALQEELSGFIGGQNNQIIFKSGQVIRVAEGMHIKLFSQSFHLILSKGVARSLMYIFSKYKPVLSAA